jgi:uncharacterized membrane protein
MDMGFTMHETGQTVAAAGRALSYRRRSPVSPAAAPASSNSRCVSTRLVAAHGLLLECLVPPQAQATRVLRTGLILGVGLIGTLDQVVLHEWLQWHNFYVHTTEFWRTAIDGVFHFVTASLLFIGALRLWGERQHAWLPGQGRRLAAGILLGMGAFNLYDGTIQHKVLQLHPVREGVENLLPYDVGFIALSLVLLGGGLLFARRTGVAR